MGSDKGRHYMVDADGKAAMFNGMTKELAKEIAAAWLLPTKPAGAHARADYSTWNPSHM